MSEKDTKIYMKKIKDKASSTGTVMEKIKTDNLAELDNLRTQAAIDEVRARMAETKQRMLQAQSGGQPVPQNQAQNYLQMLFAGRKPEEVKEILDALEPAQIQKLAQVSAALNNNQSALLMQILNRPDTSKNEIMDLFNMMIKLNPPQQQGTTWKGMAAMMKEMREWSKPQGGADPVKTAVDSVKTFYEAMSKKDAEIYNERLKNIKESMPPPLTAQIQNLKEVASAIGLGGGGKSGEMDLKLEEMRESHDIDMAKLSWEQQKFLLGQEAERGKWEAIQNTFNPIFQMAAPEVRGALKKLGKDVGKTLSTEKTPEKPSGSPPENIARFTCPKCKVGLTVPIPPNAPEEVPIKCPSCGTITPAKLGEKKEATSPPEEKPRSTRLKATYM